MGRERAKLEVWVYMSCPNSEHDDHDRRAWEVLCQQIERLCEESSLCIKTWPVAW